MRNLLATAGCLGALLVGSQVALVQAHQPTSADDVGLGTYGRVGEIKRSDLRPGLDAYVTDAAISLAQDPALRAARESWDLETDFVDQVDYQLTFRDGFDYLSSDPEVLGKLLVERPRNLGIDDFGLFLGSEEVAEFTRRSDLGDTVETLEAVLGVVPPAKEGLDPTYPAAFAGIWMDQMDGGVLIVAMTSFEGVDVDQLKRIVGDLGELRLLEVEYSWDEVDEFRGVLASRFRDAGLDAVVLDEYTAEGRLLQTAASAEDLGAADELTKSVVPSSLLLPSGEGGDERMSGPSNNHPEIEQQAGLQIEMDPGGNCTWGVNGHVAAFPTHYLVTAGHCGGAADENVQGYATLEVAQSNVFDLTDVGVANDKWVHSMVVNNFDIKRVETPQADSNCYHYSTSCGSIITARAWHNTWEPTIDIVCASLGTSNTNRCGVVVSENQTGTNCPGNRWMRADIPVVLGDSGSGVISRGGPDSIDGIAPCRIRPAGGSWDIHVNTAFDVQDQLNFDFNCAPTFRGNMAPTAWGGCPGVNR